MWTLIYCDYDEIDVVAVFENKPSTEDLLSVLKNADEPFVDSIFNNDCEFYYLRQGDLFKNENR